MSQENVTLVRSAYEAYNRRDPQALLGCFDPDIDWHVPDSLAWGDHVRGLEAIARFFEGLEPYMGDRHEVTVDELIDGGDRVVALVRQPASRRAAGPTTSRRSWSGPPPAGG